jgi:hypothetical protein
MVKHRGRNTIRVHRSAISSFLQPIEFRPMGEHLLIASFMSAVSKATPATQLRWTWPIPSLNQGLELAPIPYTSSGNLEAGNSQQYCHVVIVPSKLLRNLIINSESILYFQLN